MVASGRVGSGSSHMYEREELKAAAKRARRLAQQTYDLRLRDSLLAAAEAYERQLEGDDQPDKPA
jgi:hypothetical protein